MHVEFCALYSGSSGNAIYMASESTRLLIDAGLPARTICAGLEHIGVAPASLDALLITHEHSDHVRGAGVLSRKLDLPIYATEGTWCAMEKALGVISAHNVRAFQHTEDFYIGDIAVSPFEIPHDAAQPVGYRLHTHGQCVGVATDIGHMNKSLLAKLSECKLLLLESNHDIDMVHFGPYPAMLKKRILGNRGHLSNAACGDALIPLVENGLRHVLLGHLSDQNNRPELAFSTVVNALRNAGIIAGRDVRVDLTWRDKLGTLVNVEQ